MGAWGKGPYENDSALDWMAHVSATIAIPVEQALDTYSNSPDEGGEILRAAAQVAFDFSFYGGIDHLIPRLIAALEMLLTSEWTDSWDEPAAVRDEIQQQIQALRETLK